MTNYTIINNTDITSSSISDGAFRLYILLQSYCFGEKDTCFPSQNTLAAKLNKSVRTIQRYLKELIDAKLIQAKRRGSISNIYTIISKKMQQVGQKVVNKAKNAYKDYKNNKKDSTFSNYSQRQYTHEQFQELEKILLE